MVGETKGSSPLSAVWAFVKQTIYEWSEDNALELGAALAYYAVFSLVPLLITVIMMAGFFYGEEAARGQIAEGLHGFIGPRIANFVQGLLVHARHTSTSIPASIIGTVVSLFAATTVFAELQSALNRIWEVKAAPGQGLLLMIRQRLISFLMVLGTGLLLLFSLIVTTVMSAATHFMGSAAPGILWQAVNYGISLGVLTLLFGMIFRILPDVEISWGDVWVGSFATALLFTLGKWLISLYLSHSSIDTTFGAAGSLALILVWIYYTSQTLFLGAELTQVYAARYGSKIRPGEGMVAEESVAPPQEKLPYGGNDEAKPDEAEAGTSDGPAKSSGNIVFLRRSPDSGAEEAEVNEKVGAIAFGLLLLAGSALVFLAGRRSASPRRGNSEEYT